MLSAHPSSFNQETLLFPSSLYFLHSVFIFCSSPSFLACLIPPTTFRWCFSFNSLFRPLAAKSGGSVHQKKYVNSGLAVFICLCLPNCYTYTYLMWICVLTLLSFMLFSLLCYATCISNFISYGLYYHLYMHQRCESSLTARVNSITIYLKIKDFIAGRNKKKHEMLVVNIHYLDRDNRGYPWKINLKKQSRSLTSSPSISFLIYSELP